MNYLIKSILPVVMALLLISCDAESTSSLLDDLSTGGVDETNLVGTWRQDSFESYSGMLCSGTPTNSSTENSYVVITDTHWGTVDTDSCDLTTIDYEWNDSGTAGYIQTPNGIIRNVSLLTETSMEYQIATSQFCYKYSLTKVTAVEGCPDL